jgi:hypothetical protein
MQQPDEDYATVNTESQYDTPTEVQVDQTKVVATASSRFTLAILSMLLSIVLLLVIIAIIVVIVIRANQVRRAREKCINIPWYTMSRVFELENSNIESIALMGIDTYIQFTEGTKVYLNTTFQATKKDMILSFLEPSEKDSTILQASLLPNMPINYECSSITYFSVVYIPRSLAPSLSLLSLVGVETWNNNSTETLTFKSLGVLTDSDVKLNNFVTTEDIYVECNKATLGNVTAGTDIEIVTTELTAESVTAGNLLLLYSQVRTTARVRSLTNSIASISNGDTVLQVDDFIGNFTIQANTIAVDYRNVTPYILSSDSQSIEGYITEETESSYMEITSDNYCQVTFT